MKDSIRDFRYPGAMPWETHAAAPARAPVVVRVIDVVEPAAVLKALEAAPAPKLFKKACTLETLRCLRRYTDVGLVTDCGHTIPSGEGLKRTAGYCNFCGVKAYVESP